MKLKKIFLNSFYIFISTIIFLVFFEILARISLWLISDNNIVWNYGIDKNIGIQVYDLSELKIRIFNDSFVDKKNYNNIPVSNKKLEIWTFGGSTTFGHNCNSNTSSWPNELNKFMPNWTIHNFSRKGKNSDFAYREFISALEKNKPDWILWANRINEVDVLLDGLDRNKNKIGHLFKRYNDNYYNVNKIILYLHRLDKTLKNYFIFYFMSNDIYSRILYKLGHTEHYLKVRKIRNIIFNKQNLPLAALNYVINTQDILKHSEEHDFKVALVTLIKKSDLIKINDSSQQYYELWDKIFLNEVKKLANHNRAFWIDTRKGEYSYNSIEELFCDEIHQTLEGNIQTAKSILKNLLKLN